MKLALVRQRYNPYGGAERFVERALRALRESGEVSVTLIARQWNGTPDAQRQFLRCDPPYLGRLWRDWSFARAVRQRIATERFDLVQSHERIDGCDIYRAGDGVHAQWLDNRARVLNSLQRWGQCCSPWHRYTLAAERRLLTSKRLKAVICNSRMVADEISRRFGVAADRLHVIYNGVDLKQFHPGLREQYRESMRAQWRIAPDTMVFLFLGSGFERKGVATLLRAFARTIKSHANTILVITGEDRHAQRYQALARQLGVADRIRWTGPQSDPRTCYGMADAFVLPTLYDPFPNAVLEAMACGLPVLTSWQCGAAELLSAGTTGWVCDALDIEALSGFMGRLNVDTAHEMGAAAHAVAKRYPVDRMVRELHALYRSLG